MVTFRVPLHLDKDMAIRKCCPLCKGEFKIVLTGEELRDSIQRQRDSFLIEQDISIGSEQEDPAQGESMCPYCGQKASGWWTQSQIAYFMTIARNIAVEELNKMAKRIEMTTRNFKANRIVLEEPIIPPEPDDMKVFELPCCDRKVKIEEDWSNTVYCFFCGFPHKSR